MQPGLIPQKDGSVAISFELPQAQVSAEILQVLAELAREGAIIHPTTAQKIMILRLDEEKALDALKRLEKAGAFIRKAGKSLQPRTCVGLPFCKIALKETFPLSEAIWEAFPAEELPHKFKVAVAGCPACCCWANTVDLGFVGVREGYKILVGGKGGYKPKAATYLTTVSSKEEAISIMRGVLNFFKEKGEEKKRFAVLLEKEGIDSLKKYLNLS
ncbi:nitrite and sulphite reductase 4Fe-4S region [Thermodesulfatator indicus DSM 15286]|uniref:Nitrite and sulphite reductase 4Fe-4S region n=1 Tax=Thermodesulfatator indicus (strain DSM 15286 / JCM 11887 / CIR29812) TaxID=667014 RepID=F8A8V9_THEID|nr:nitrate/sulfite reductase [Thermodesulfatator indicus]AEH44006.1 nitrite and sulphite reductase 4Fe-4S region [Thermodesulfatator indicus DSM 15286]